MKPLQSGVANKTTIPETRTAELVEEKSTEEEVEVMVGVRA